jgi:putative ABC transport system substrate-binding protein
MRRREFIGFLSASGFACLEAEAQQQGKVYRIGILTPAQSDQTPIFRAFRQALAELGYVEGRNIVIEFRSAHAFHPSSRISLPNSSRCPSTSS